MIIILFYFFERDGCGYLAFFLICKVIYFYDFCYMIESSIFSLKDGKRLVSSVLLNRGSLLFFLMPLIFVACRGKDPAAGKMIFRYNEAAGITTLDPAYSKNQALNWACSQLYNGLIQLDGNLNPQPCLAKSWTISSDGRTYTFTLRDDVFFHKNALFGTPDSTRRVVAADFVYTSTEYLTRRWPHQDYGFSTRLRRMVLPLPTILRSLFVSRSHSVPFSDC